MNSDRIKEIQKETAHPDSVSVQQALLKVWNECRKQKKELLTDDEDIRDTVLSMDVGGNGDYYLTLIETKRGKIIRLDTRIATSGGNASTEVLRAISNLYKALQQPKAVEKFYCWNESCNNEIPEPVECCSGRDCGCGGQPIDPPFCSNECHKEYASNQQKKG